MKKLCALLIVLLLTMVSGLFLSVCAAADLTDDSPNLWHATFLPCNKYICGGFDANAPSRSLTSGQVIVDSMGQVKVKLHGVRLLTGEIEANKQFEILFGSFLPNFDNADLYFDYYAVHLGFVTTDAEGNVNGAVDAGGGIPYSFASDSAFSGQFIVNEPGVRSEFITGFAVP